MRKISILMLFAIITLFVGNAWASNTFQHQQLISRYSSVDESAWDIITNANKAIIDEDFLNVLKAGYYQFVMDAETQAKKTGKPRAIPSAAYFYANLADYVAAKIKMQGGMRFKLAQAYVEDRRLDTALEICNIIRNQDPKNIEVTQYLGELFVRMNMLKEAMDLYTDLLKIDKDNRIALFRMGMLYNTLGRNKDAAMMFKRLLKVDPDNEVARKFIDMFEGKSSGGNKKISEEAIQHFMNAERLFGAEKFEEAAEEYSKAIEADPQFAKAYIYLGECLTRLKKYSEAVEIINHGIQLAPKDPESHSFLGIALERQFDFKNDRALLEQAVKSYEEACRLAPKEKKYTENLDRARKRLEKLSG